MAVHEKVDIDAGVGKLGDEESPPFAPALVVGEQGGKSGWPAVVAFVVALVEAGRAVDEHHAGADKRHESGRDKEEGDADVLLQGLRRHDAAGYGLETCRVERAHQRREEPQGESKAQEISVAHPAFRRIEKSKERSTHWCDSIPDSRLCVEGRCTRRVRSHDESYSTCGWAYSNLSGRKPDESEIASWIGRGGPLGGKVTSTHSCCPGFSGNGGLAVSGMK